MNAYIEKHINSNAVGFWEPTPPPPNEMLSNANKKTHNKSSDKLVTDNADGLFWQAPVLIKPTSGLSERCTEH